MFQKFCLLVACYFCIHIFTQDSSILFAQQSNRFKDEKELYSSTKQVNQFFRRFNNEESSIGTRYYLRDSLFRDPKTRGKYLNMLFDNQNFSITKELKNQFVADVNNKANPVFLDFHGGKWFAQASTLFMWHGREEKLTIYLNLQEEEVGSKWVITYINFPPFNLMYSKDSSDDKYFLHPLSHELDFLNLNKVFQNNKNYLESYTSKDFHPDHLTLFLNEVKKGNLKFVTVSGVKFHFFQVNNWYFELKEFNRSGYNTGWLISNLTKANDQEKLQLEKFILSRNE